MKVYAKTDFQLLLLLLSSRNIGQFNVIPKCFEHFHEGFVHDTVLLLLPGRADGLADLLLGHVGFKAFHLHIKLNIVLNHAVFTSS